MYPGSLFRIFFKSPVLGIMLAGLLFCGKAVAQERTLTYIIKRDGDQVGQMQVKETVSDKKRQYRLVSDVKTSFIFTFRAHAREESLYDQDVLVYSSVYQKMNGEEQFNKQTRFTGSNYVIRSKSSEEKFNSAGIRYNLICLYFIEPLHTDKVYSDRYQKFLTIRKKAEHHYQIKFPDGNTNDYYYRDGQVTKIEVDHTFYSAVMELKR